MKKIYYAHCMSIYDTIQEIRDLNTINLIFPNDEIINPNNPKSSDGYKKEGMEYFIKIIKSCDILVFRSLVDCKIPAGVYKEIQCAVDNNIPVIELPSRLKSRYISVEETREYLNEVGFR